LGVPPSKLDGREPGSTTQHVYDRRGRLLRSVTTREPEWTEQDVAEVLALAEHEARLCPGGCGHLLDDTTTPEDTGPEFNAKVVTCRACADRLAVQRSKENDPDAGARIWSVGMKRRG
jgi:hypothetical protein